MATSLRCALACASTLADLDRELTRWGLQLVTQPMQGTTRRCLVFPSDVPMHEADRIGIGAGDTIADAISTAITDYLRQLAATMGGTIR